MTEHHLDIDAVSPTNKNAHQPLAVRRIRKLRASAPEARPADIAQQLERLFLRDFTLVGGAQAGASEFTPNAVGRLTRNRTIATATLAASHLGSAGQKIANVNQSARQGVGTAAQVGSAQAVKTYVHAMALLAGKNYTSSDEAAQEVLGGDVHELLATLDRSLAQSQTHPQANSKVNIFGAAGVIAARNPKTFLLVKAGEQIARTGSAIMTTTRVRKEFATQLIEQIKHNLGELPTEFSAKDEITKNEPTSSDSNKTSQLDSSSSHKPIGSTPVAEEFDPRTATGASATGARFAAKAFMKASRRFKK